MKTLPLSGLTSVLCIGAHCDDIEIGCGGTILRLVEVNPGLRVHWIVFTSDAERGSEARAGASAFLEGASDAVVEVEEYRERFLPYVAIDVKERFDRLGNEVDPDLVLTHCRDDRHQDHRLLSELTYNTFRDHLVLEYEIAKYDADLGQPNTFVPLEERHCGRKVDLLMDIYRSQVGKYWFTEDTFRALLRLRGVESRSPTGMAEAFHCRKLTLA